ncbi:MAG: phage integrase N-terminal SAM-like domain-containing protein [Steroidobacteraceae bacterium]
MLERRRGFLEFVAERLRGRELPVAVQATYLRHIEQYLRFHNEAPQTQRLAELPAEQAVEAYLTWLEGTTTVDPAGMDIARQAIGLLYSDVFRIPLNRP